MFGDRLKQLREKAHLTLDEVAAKYNSLFDGKLNKGTLSRYENNKQEPMISVASRFAELFGVSTDFMLDGTTGDSNDIAQKVGAIPVESVTMLPVVGTVKAGWDGGIDAEYIGEEPAYDLPHQEGYVWLVVKGTSMEPDLRDGDLVLVRLQSNADSGDFVVAIVNGDEGTVKRFMKYDTGVMLEPMNREYSAQYISASDVENLLFIYGVVVESKRKFK